MTQTVTLGTNGDVFKKVRFSIKFPSTLSLEHCLRAFALTFNTTTNGILSHIKKYYVLFQVLKRDNFL